MDMNLGKNLFSLRYLLYKLLIWFVLINSCYYARLVWLVGMHMDVHTLVMNASKEWNWCVGSIKFTRETVTDWDLSHRDG
jgi:hypothetical protein